MCLLSSNQKPEFGSIFIVHMSDIARIHTPFAISVMHMYAESFPIQQADL